MPDQVHGDAASPQSRSSGVILQSRSKMRAVPSHDAGMCVIHDKHGPQEVTHGTVSYT